MNKSAILLLLFAPFFAFCQKPEKVNIIPEPVSVSAKNTVFLLNETTSIVYPEGKADWDIAAGYLAGILSPATGFHLKAAPVKGKIPGNTPNSIIFLSDEKITHPEGYQLDVGKKNIIVRAKTAAGAFYAAQTIRQLFPAAINANTLQAGIEWVAQGCAIEDYPRFGYRGLMLDVGRNWFPVPFIKRYIDMLAMHKLNSFHWHLTEDQGWRIEIKRYPKLQQIAACREETLVGHYTDQPMQYDGTKYCHYYTQEEVKEVVEYARKRFITIIPEIEMPGHALAALAAYPELGCEGAGYETATKWGVVEDVYCAGNEKVFSFLDGVLEEVAGLFPGTYIHIGGDECPKTRWKECHRCQAAMKREGLKDEHELQSYFIGRAEKMLAKYGKKLIGWDEILEGGLAPTATVMSWRGEEGGIAAAKANHDAIMTPSTYVYFDYYQSDPETEPLAIGGLLTLEKVYSYEPIPADFTQEQAKHIIGVQGNLWTEYIQTPDKVEYMAFPRSCALAEIAWSQPSRRSWESFSGRLPTHFDRLAALKVNFAKSYFDVKTAFMNGKVHLSSTDPSIQIKYTTDGTEPGASTAGYTGPFAISKNTTVKAAAFKGDQKMGKTVVVNYLMHKASGKPYTMTFEPKKFDGGEKYALTNGITGGLKTEGAWVGLVNHDIDPVIDLGESMPINRIITHYANSKGDWIHPPKAIEVFVSEDGINFFSEGRKLIDPEEKMNNSIETIAFSLKQVKGRYVKLLASTTGVIPKGYPGAGEGAWLFIDEVIVE